MSGLYYTFFELDWRAAESLTVPECEKLDNQVILVLLNPELYLPNSYGGRFPVNVGSGDKLESSEATWSDRVEDMKKLSIYFPEIVFSLRGEGESAGDIWKEYYFNGKVQEAHAIISFEEFDVHKLK